MKRFIYITFFLIYSLFSYAQKAIVTTSENGIKETETADWSLCTGLMGQAKMGPYNEDIYLYGHKVNIISYKGGNQTESVPLIYEWDCKYQGNDGFWRYAKNYEDEITGQWIFYLLIKQDSENYIFTQCFY